MTITTDVDEDDEVRGDWKEERTSKIGGEGDKSKDLDRMILVPKDSEGKNKKWGCQKN